MVRRLALHSEARSKLLKYSWRHFHTCVTILILVAILIWISRITEGDIINNYRTFRNWSSVEG